MTSIFVGYADGEAMVLKMPTEREALWIGKDGSFVIFWETIHTCLWCCNFTTKTYKDWLISFYWICIIITGKSSFFLIM